MDGLSFLIIERGNLEYYTVTATTATTSTTIKITFLINLT